MSTVIAALDIGGTNIKSCIFENGISGEISETPTEAQFGAVHMLSNAVKLLERYGNFDAIGISTAGQVDPETGILKYSNSNIPDYTGTNVAEFFRTRFSKPVAVLNDVYAAAIGEGHFGAAVGITDYICITYGTGIGGGIVLGGSPYYGAGVSAGVMLGGIITHPEKRDLKDPFSGSYERAASTTALVLEAKKIDSSILTGRDVISKMNDPRIHKILDSWIEEIVTGLCTVIHSYNIPCVILGGGIMEQPYIISQVQMRVNESVIPGFRCPLIIGAKLGNTAGLYGAMYSADRLLTHYNSPQKKHF